MHTQGPTPPDATRTLQRVLDVNGLYKILGDCIIDFMVSKPQPFLSNALASQEHFWRVPTYKRAMVFVFLIRFVLGYPSQSQWKKFTVGDMKLNTRAFKRWSDKEEAVMEQSLQLADLDEYAPEEAVVGKRKLKLSSVSDASSSPVKRVFVVDSESTEDED